MAVESAAANGLLFSQCPAFSPCEVDERGDQVPAGEWAIGGQAHVAPQRHRGLGAHAEDGLDSLPADVANRGAGVGTL